MCFSKRRFARVPARTAWQIVICAFAMAGPAVAGTIYVDDNAPSDPGPGNPAVSDPLENGSADHPFDAIQKGINAAVAGDTVEVADGLYTGTGNKDLDFKGKAITVRFVSDDPVVCIIDCQGNAGYSVAVAGQPLCHAGNVALRSPETDGNTGTIYCAVSINDQ